jgi:drug/metabolite transporter (DMT)-like permease
VGKDGLCLMPSQRLKADITLLIVAAIWGSAFVAQRLVAAQVGVFLFNGLRFMLAVLVLLPLALRSERPRQPWKAGDRWLVALLGVLLASGAALQQWGLRYTTAANAGFVTGLYVVIIPFVLAFGWRETPRTVIWLASALGAVGLFLLSTSGTFLINPGDALELAGAFVWAFHVILLGRLVQRLDILTLSVVQYLLCGALSLLLAFFVEGQFQIGTFDGWMALVYTGLFSVGLGYTLQAVGQRHAPPADAAILLSMESVFAALFGWWILGEGLSGVQLLGCALMFAGIVLAQLRPRLAYDASTTST